MDNKKPNSKLISLGVLIGVVVLVIVVSAITKHTKTAADSAVTPTVALASPAKNSTAMASVTTDPTAASTVTTSSTSTYKAGTYTESGSYQTPQTTETINVTLTLSSDGTITATSVSQTPQDHDSREYQQRFASSYQSLVIGKNISTLRLGTISGSSLTPTGFDKAVAVIASEAKA